MNKDYLEKIYDIIYAALTTQMVITVPKMLSDTKYPYMFFDFTNTIWADSWDESIRDVLYRGETEILLTLKFKVAQDTSFTGEKRKTQSYLMRLIEKALETIDVGIEFTIGQSGDSYKVRIDDISLTRDIYDINNNSQEGEAVRYISVKHTRV